MNSELSSRNLIYSIVNEFETLGEFKMFLVIFEKNISGEDPIIPYSFFMEKCRTDKTVIRRAIEKLVDKNYITKEPILNSFRYRLTDKTYTLLETEK